MTIIDWISILVYFVIALSIKRELIEWNPQIDDFSDIFWFIVKIIAFLALMFINVSLTDEIYPYFIYLFAIVILLTIGISLHIRERIIDKKERQNAYISAINNIKCSPIFNSIINEFSSHNNYSVIYICCDGVAFSSEYSIESIKPKPREHIHFNASSQKEANRILVSAANKWLDANSHLYSVDSISFSSKKIYYSTYGYNNINYSSISNISLISKLIADSLGLECDFCTKEFYEDERTICSRPTGAIVYNGNVTFKYSSSKFYGANKDFVVYAAIYKASAKKPVVPKKSW